MRLFREIMSIIFVIISIILALNNELLIGLIVLNSAKILMLESRVYDEL